MVSEVNQANRLTGVYAGVGVPGVRYQFVAVSWHNALLREEWRLDDGTWVESGLYVLCSLAKMVVNERGIEMSEAGMRPHGWPRWPFLGGSQGAGGGC